MPKLRFVAAAGKDGAGFPMTPHYGLQEQGIRAFHGVKADATIGAPFLNAMKGGQPDRHMAFVAVDGPEAIEEVDFSSPYRNEYIRHLKDGDLLPADAYTASVAGVKFDPSLAKAAFRVKAEVEAPAATAAELFAAAQKAHGAPSTPVAKAGPPAAAAESKVS